MKPPGSRFFAPLLLCSLAATGMVRNPVIDTDRSVNTHSLQTIVGDLITPDMTDERKLDALFTFHRRMMHHFRTTRVEDNFSDFDLVRMYNVYGCSWCTQQTVIFRQLCGAVFGTDNTRGEGGDGRLAGKKGARGGHSSFSLRFNEKDTWHWIDPIIGAWARNKTGNTIASLADIAADPSILIDAERDSRASWLYFPCARGANPIHDTLSGAYGYFVYDTAFMSDYAKSSLKQPAGSQAGVRQDTYWTTRKNLHRGESYTWLWDFLPGNRFVLCDREVDKNDRSWQWYPPRHLCGAKDSADIRNWPYFRPYKKSINGQDCYRYYANGIHRFAPDLKTPDPKDGAWSLRNVALYSDDRKLPALKPAAKGPSEISWRVILPYPLLSMEISGDYQLSEESDSLALDLAPLFFEPDSATDSVTRKLLTACGDTLFPEPFRTVHRFPVSRQTVRFARNLDSIIDPVFNRTASAAYGKKIKKRYTVKTDSASTTYLRTYYGYILRVRAHFASDGPAPGLYALSVRCVFQHNMFALPQFEPGVNKVSVTADSGDLGAENLKVGFAWEDQGKQKQIVKKITSAAPPFTVTVNQKTVPRMIRMWLNNTREDRPVE